MDIHSTHFCHVWYFFDIKNFCRDNGFLLDIHMMLNNIPCCVNICGFLSAKTYTGTLLVRTLRTKSDIRETTYTAKDYINIQADKNFPTEMQLNALI